MVIVERDWNIYLVKEIKYIIKVINYFLIYWFADLQKFFQIFQQFTYKTKKEIISTSLVMKINLKKIYIYILYKAASFPIYLE